MAKDPAFLFYPGDYLRDTQCLSAAAQVAYDRIMCEHMRKICKDMNNICVSYDKHNFFTKRLTPDEKHELNDVLIECEGGYYIDWVRDSISKRRAYSESRAKNREGKTKKHMNNICEHMENEIEDENINGNKGKKRKKKEVKEEKEREERKVVMPWPDISFQLAWNNWKEYRRKEHKFSYKRDISEQAALHHLCEESGGHLDNALKIIQKSISNGWKGLFKLQDHEQIKRTIKSGTEVESEIDDALTRHYSR